VFAQMGGQALILVGLMASTTSLPHKQTIPLFNHYRSFIATPNCLITRAFWYILHVGTYLTTSRSTLFQTPSNWRHGRSSDICWCTEYDQQFSHTDCTLKLAAPALKALRLTNILVPTGGECHRCNASASLAGG